MDLPGPIEDDRWYKLKAEARGNRLRCYLDGKWMINETWNMIGSGCVGLHVNGSNFAFRDIKVVSADREVLLQGLPDLDAPKK